MAPNDDGATDCVVFLRGFLPPALALIDEAAFGADRIISVDTYEQQRLSSGLYWAIQM